MPAGRKRRCPHVELNANIPEREDNIVTHVEVTRNTRQRIHTKSNKVSIPAVDPPPRQPSPPQPPESLLSSEFTPHNPPQ